MPVYACIITGSLRLNKEGEDCDIYICAGEYVFASGEREAKRKSKEKFLKGLNETGKVLQENLIVEKIQQTKFWAIWSRTAFWTYQNEADLKKAAIENVTNWHRYIK